MNRTCANCGTELQGAYCHGCGQRDFDVRIAIWELLKEAASEAFELDGRIASTVGPWLFKPGQLVSDYVSGRRRRYTEPVRIFLFALMASFICFQLAGARSLGGVADKFADAPFEIVDHSLAFELRDDEDKGGSFSIGLDDRSERWFHEGIEKLEGRTQAQAASMLLDGFLDATPIVVVALVPLFALLLELCYPRFLVIEHLLLSANLHALGLVVLGVTALIGHPLADLVALSFLGWHLVAAQRRIYAKRWWVVALKTGVLASGYFLLMIFAFLGSLFITLWTL